MKIICTVSEFADLVRGCNDFRNGAVTCSKCPLSSCCTDGFIEQFISAKDVIEEDAE